LTSENTETTRGITRVLSDPDAPACGINHALLSVVIAADARIAA
jgi:hypothetical protein